MVRISLTDKVGNVHTLKEVWRRRVEESVHVVELGGDSRLLLYCNQDEEVVALGESEYESELEGKSISRLSGGINGMKARYLRALLPVALFLQGGSH